MLKDGRAWSLWSDFELTDYVDLGCAPRWRADVAQALIDQLAASRCNLRFANVPSDHPLLLAAAADSRGTVRGAEIARSWRAELPDSWEAFVAALTKKERHELLRKERRGARSGEVAIAAVGPRELEHEAERFISWHRASRGPKAGFMTADVAAWFLTMLRMTAEQHHLRFDVLRIGEVPVAAAVGFQSATSYLYYAAAYDPAAADLSPGILLLARLIQRAIGARLSCFDFLRGDEAYKRRLGASPHPLIAGTIAIG